MSTIKVIQIDQDKEQHSQFIIQKDNKFFEENFVKYEEHDRCAIVSKIGIIGSLAAAGIKVILSESPVKRHHTAMPSIIAEIKSEILAQVDNKNIIVQISYPDKSEFTYLTKTPKGTKTIHSPKEIWEDETLTKLFDFEYHYSLALPTSTYS